MCLYVFRSLDYMRYPIIVAGVTTPLAQYYAVTPRLEMPTGKAQLRALATEDSPQWTPISALWQDDAETPRQSTTTAGLSSLDESLVEMLIEDFTDVQVGTLVTYHIL